jgi:hypothetical protein
MVAKSTNEIDQPGGPDCRALVDTRSLVELDWRPSRLLGFFFDRCIFAVRNLG